MPIGSSEWENPIWLPFKKFLFYSPIHECHWIFAVSQSVMYESETMCTPGTRTIGPDSIIQDSLHPSHRNCKIQKGKIYLKAKKQLDYSWKNSPQKTFFLRWFSHLVAMNSSEKSFVIKYGNDLIILSWFCLFVFYVAADLLITFLLKLWVNISAQSRMIRYC